jgi:hypothetical protein
MNSMSTWTRRGALGALIRIVSVALGVAAFSAAALPAADHAPPEPAATPVAWVDGEPITLRQLEDEMLRKEGADKLIELVERQLTVMPWQELDDDDVLLAMGQWQVPRVLLAARLLEEVGPKVRTDLVGMTVVHQAMERHGVVVDDAALREELERQEAAFHQILAEKDQPRVPFANYLQVQEGQTLEEYMSSEAFRLAAGLHALVYKLAPLAATIEEETAILREHFQAHRPRFGKAEAWRLAIIHRPYQVPSGQEGVDDQIRNEAVTTLQHLAGQIADGRNHFTFAKAWKYWGRPFDPGADSGGVIGWVGRNGEPSVEDAQPLPPALIDDIAAAIDDAAGEDFPLLLPVCAHERGVALVQVLGHRPADLPAYEDVAWEVRKDYIRQDLEKWTSKVRTRLQREAEVRFASWPALLQRRKEDTAAYEQALVAPLHEADVAADPTP